MRYLKELFQFKDLLWSLSAREIKLRYQPSSLGIAWAVLQPLSLMLVFVLVFSRFARFPSEGVPYSLFVLCALVPWTFFANGLSFGSISLLNNAQVVSKVYFPREIVPISSAVAAGLDYLVGMGFLLGLLIFYKVQVDFSLLWIVPLFFLQVLFTVGLMLLSSALIVLWRDLKYALPLVLQLWMFLTPVVYSWNVVPEQYHWVRWINPMVMIIDGYRQAILHQGFVKVTDLAILAAGIGVFFLASYHYFKRKEMLFADIF